MTNDLTGSTALITGGTSGIGRAAALSLARLGATCTARSCPSTEAGSPSDPQVP